MTNLLFFLWMLLYPLASSFEMLINSFVFKIREEDPQTQKLSIYYAIFQVVIYLGVGYLLFKYQ